MSCTLHPRSSLGQRINYVTLHFVSVFLSHLFARQPRLYLCAFHFKREEECFSRHFGRSSAGFSRRGFVDDMLTRRRRRHARIYGRLRPSLYAGALPQTLDHHGGEHLNTISPLQVCCGLRGSLPSGGYGAM